LKRENENKENEINVLKEENNDDSEIQLREYELDGNEFMLKTPSRKMERIVSKRLPKNDSICEQKLSLSMIPIPFFEKESSEDEFKQPTLVMSKNTSIESIHKGSSLCENKSFVDQENVLMSNLEIGDQESEGEDKTKIWAWKEENVKLRKILKDNSKENEINVLKEEIDNDSEIQLREYELDGNEFMLKTPSCKMERIVSKLLPKNDSFVNKN
jgi:hypothetical protein